MVRVIRITGSTKLMFINTVIFLLDKPIVESYNRISCTISFMSSYAIA